MTDSEFDIFSFATDGCRLRDWVFGSRSLESALASWFYFEYLGSVSERSDDVDSITVNVKIRKDSIIR